jgi:hypothetical protein
MSTPVFQSIKFKIIFTIENDIRINLQNTLNFLFSSAAYSFRSPQTRPAGLKQCSERNAMLGKLRNPAYRFGD